MSRDGGKRRSRSDARGAVDAGEQRVVRNAHAAGARDLVDAGERHVLGSAHAVGERCDARGAVDAGEQRVVRNAHAAGARDVVDASARRVLRSAHAVGERCDARGAVDAGEQRVVRNAHAAGARDVVEASARRVRRSAHATGSRSAASVEAREHSRSILRGTAFLFASCLALSSCGSDADSAFDMRVGFKAHELECTIEGKLEAKLQVAGVAGDCELDVADNRTVSGVCGGIPTGVARMFRLLYFIMIDGQQVDLAVVLKTVDLSGETRSTITVEFPSDDVMTEELDFDADGVSNIREVCMGRDPLIRDS